jgi:hypothetical protein
LEGGVVAPTTSRADRGECGHLTRRLDDRRR